MKIKLTPERTSEAVRVGLGLTLRTEDGVAVRGDVTWQGYDRIAQLEDGTVGVLRQKYERGQYTYWLEAGEANQDWQAETTTWTLPDGRRVLAGGAGWQILPAGGPAYL